jgi:hypothetical protein
MLPQCRGTRASATRFRRRVASTRCRDATRLDPPARCPLGWPRRQGPGAHTVCMLAFLTLLLNSQWRQKACWYTIQSQINPQAHGYHYSFHLGVFQGIDFLGE